MAGSVSGRAPAHGVRMEASQRRRQLLDAALTQFGELGYTATSMNDIALSAGVTKPVLYQHFESKKDLFLEVLTDTANELVAKTTEAVDAATSGRLELESAVHAYVDFFGAEPGRFRVMYGEGARSDPDFVEAVHNVEVSMASFTAEHIAIESLSTDERLIIARAITGALENGVRRWLEHGGEHPGALLSTLVWRGLRGAGSS